MMHLPASVRVYLCASACDMRKSFDGLHALVTRAAGYTGPLNRCSFYGSKAAGDKLKAMLAAGHSRPWPETLKLMTGEDRVDASAMVEYFQPLLTWLRQQNAEANEKTGWTVGADPMKAH